MKMYYNGKSFNMADIFGAIGGKLLELPGIRERLKMIGGRFYIESLADKDTDIIAQIPV
jgi:signal transduction histidine kinase